MKRKIKSLVNFGAWLDKWVPKFFKACYADVTREELYNIAFCRLSDLWLDDLSVEACPTRGESHTRTADFGVLFVCLFGLYAVLPGRRLYKISDIVGGIGRMLRKTAEEEKEHPWLDRQGRIAKARRAVEREKRFRERSSV